MTSFAGFCLAPSEGFSPDVERVSNRCDSLEEFKFLERRPRTRSVARAAGESLGAITSFVRSSLVSELAGDKVSLEGLEVPLRVPEGVVVPLWLLLLPLVVRVS